jgi:hypothetical protein
VAAAAVGESATQTAPGAAASDTSAGVNRDGGYTSTGTVAPPQLGKDKKARRARCLTLCKDQLLCRVRRERGIYLVSFAGGEIPAFYLACLRLLAAAGVIFITVWAWTRYSDPLGYRLVTLTGWGLIITALYFFFASVGYFLAVLASGRGKRVGRKLIRCDCRNERTKLLMTPSPSPSSSSSTSGQQTARPIDTIADVNYLLQQQQPSSSAGQAASTTPATADAILLLPTPLYRPVEKQWTIDNYPPAPQGSFLRRLQKVDFVVRGIVIMLWAFCTIEVVITILFWAGGGALGLLDFNGRTSSQIVSSALQHAMLPFLLVDLALSRMPVLPAHCLYLLLLYIAYLFANIMYTTVGPGPVYKNITWANGQSYGVAIAGGAILALAFGFSWFLSEVKRRACHYGDPRFYKRKVPSHLAGQQVAMVSLRAPASSTTTTTATVEGSGEAMVPSGRGGEAIEGVEAEQKEVPLPTVVAVEETGRRSVLVRVISPTPVMTEADATTTTPVRLVAGIPQDTFLPQPRTQQAAEDEMLAAVPVSLGHTPPSAALALVPVSRLASSSSSSRSGSAPASDVQSALREAKTKRTFEGGIGEV